MMRFTLAQVMANRVRLGLTLVAIVLGVAFVTGSMVLSATAQRLFDQQFTTANAGADLTVRQATEFDSGMGVEVERDPLPADLLDRISGVEGVTEAVAIAKGTVRLEASGRDLGSLQLTTFVPTPLGAYPVLQGRAPAAPAEAVIDSAAAARLDLSIGDRLVLTGPEREQVSLVGLVGFGDSDGPPVGAIVLTDLSTAQRTLGLGEAVSEVLVAADVPVAEMQTALAVRLGDEVQVASVQDLAAAGAEAAAANLQLLQIVLIAMSAAALLIGSFLIANTFSIVVEQRTAQLAVLRAVGASGRQVLGSVLAEAAVVGAAASAAGAALGIGGALGLRNLAQAFGVSLPDGDLAVAPATLVVAIGLGTGVTLLAALGPARRASRIAPVVALRSTMAEGRRFPTARVASGAAVLLVGAGLSAAPTFGAPILLLGVGLALVTVGLIVMGPVIVRPLVAALTPAVSRIGVPGRLAAETARRAPRRTSVTVMALSLTLAMMTFITIVIASVKDATAEQYREVVSADVVVESAAQEMLGGVHPEVFDEVTARPEVAAVARLRYGHWRDGDVTSALSAIDPSTIVRAARIQMVDGSLDALRTGGVIVAERVANDRGLSIGDAIPMTFARDGETELELVGVMADASAQALQTDWFVSLERYDELFTEEMDASLFVIGRDGVAADALTAALREELADHPGVQVRDQAAVIEGRTKTVDQLFGLVTVLLAFAMVMAVLGIANTLALSIAERTRELGLLRAVGMSRSGAATMVLAEAALTTIIAAAVGVTLGAGAAMATVGALSLVAPLPIVIPIGGLSLTVATIVVAGLVAGIAPAHRASRLPVLEAIAHA